MAAGTCMECGREELRKYKLSRCNRCYQAFYKARLAAGHVRPRGRSHAEVVASILAKTTPGWGGCVLSTGRISDQGYGLATNTLLKQVKAHRITYEAFIGPIPDGLNLDHLCHTRDTTCPGGPSCIHRRCVNPHHLEPVTTAENTRRGRLPKLSETHCPQGHEYTDENTYVIRRPKRQPTRRCRECQLDYDRLRRAARRETASPQSPAS